MEEWVHVSGDDTSEHVSAFAWATDDPEADRETEGRLAIRTLDGVKRTYVPVQRWTYEELRALAEGGGGDRGVSFDELFVNEVRENPATSVRERP